MKSILVVDDEPSMLEMVKLLLSNEGYHVLEAANGKCAMEYLKNESPELVITDIIMAEMDGMEIIGMSGGNKISSEDYLESAAALGADRALSKPFTLPYLLKAIRELIED